MTDQTPQPPAGWYPHPSMVDTVRYWDGSAWTDSVAPAGTAAAMPAAETRPCPYCHSPMAVDASRCPSCAGELRDCPRCKQKVATVSKQKFVGVVRGGMKTQVRCATCNTILDGPRW